MAVDGEEPESPHASLSSAMATAGLPDPCLLAPTSSLRSRSTPPGELGKGVWGYWELGAWKPLGISGRQRARLRKEVLLAGEDWAYDPPRGEMRTKRKGNKVDCIAAEKRANTVELMKKMPQMLLDYKRLQLRLLVVCTGCRARGCRWPRGRRPGSRRTRVCRRRTTGPSAWSSLTRSSTASSASSPRRSDGTTLTPSGWLLLLWFYIEFGNLVLMIVRRLCHLMRKSMHVGSLGRPVKLSKELHAEEHNTCRA
nr:uncharacterized protein LOC109760770 isoform X4 [Aegilops tauschii subsp. strangulata]